YGMLLSGEIGYPFIRDNQAAGNAYMEIKMLDKDIYAGKRFTAHYKTSGYYFERSEGSGSTHGGFRNTEL
ncbi:MAG: hypothetical protein ACI4BB_10950, partial [Coprococcus sp.]